MVLFVAIAFVVTKLWQFDFFFCHSHISGQIATCAAQQLPSLSGRQPRLEVKSLCFLAKKHQPKQATNIQTNKDALLVLKQSYLPRIRVSLPSTAPIIISLPTFYNSKKIQGRNLRITVFKNFRYSKKFHNFFSWKYFSTRFFLKDWGVARELTERVFIAFRAKEDIHFQQFHW